MGPGKGLLILGLMCVLTKSDDQCNKGYNYESGGCVDEDECQYMPCGKHALCKNTAGSYECHCPPGFEKSTRTDNVKSTNGQCQDINECLGGGEICGHTAVCSNLIGSYKCTCRSGYNGSKERGLCIDVDECEEAEIAQEDICGMKGTCKNVNGSYWCECQQGYTNYGKRETPCSEVDECEEAEIAQEDICGMKGTCKNVNGSYWCNCQQGYTNYGIRETPCSKLDCDTLIVPEEPLEGLAAISVMMRNSCLALSTTNPADEGKANGEVLLEKLFTATETILSPGQLNNTEEVSELLRLVEDFIRFVGPQLKDNSTRINSSQTDIDIALQRTKTRPTGPIHLTSESARLDTDWETASGNGTYPGFAMAALLSYKNLGEYVNESFEELKMHEEKNAVDPTFQISSKVVSVVVSNPLTQKLSRDVNITFRHLQDLEESPERQYICAYWNERGAWSKDGCRQQRSNATHTVCQCKHLSSFAVLMALYPMEHTFGLVMATKIGLTISLVCLILCILTFKFCHSIKGTRTTIHLHLCLCLFVADLVFLAGISQTKPVGGCRFVAALLHYFFLGVFAWMLLEGVQLYRMVVLVFNATIRPLYLFIAGYGMPLVIVIMSAIIRPEGYGTDQYCWLTWQKGLIWSFYGPVCFIIVVNVFFFIITVWKLAQKFTSLNPDLSKLHKIKAFTVTAIAQMCILGLMWVFGAFLFQEEVNTAVAYIFTILNSLQGALVFIMHCLLSKQVREEYFHLLSCICPPQKKRYSDLSSTNPSSSQSQGSRSGQNTGESQI